jgi:ATP-dependent RNA helicase DeaD
LLAEQQPKQAIIFCRTKRGVDKIHRRLLRKWPAANCIHGDLQQSARDRVMASFREGKVQLLVATDVVGRGIDVSGISHIVNYDIPQFCDDYVHRVGRTGRMGREGIAFTFVTPEEGGELTRIEIRIDKLLKRHEVHGFDAQPARPVASPSAQPGTPGQPGSGELGSGELGSGEAAAPKPAPPMFGRGGRPIRRIRRAL